MSPFTYRPPEERRGLIQEVTTTDSLHVAGSRRGRQVRPVPHDRLQRRLVSFYDRHGRETGPLDPEIETERASKQADTQQLSTHNTPNPPSPIVARPVPRGRPPTLALTTDQRMVYTRSRQQAGG